MLERRLPLWISLFLLLSTLTVYWQVTGYDFTNYDDELYVTQNQWVQAGVTAKSVARAFRTLDVCNWHPATWFSHMLVCEFFGLNPFWHHLTNLILHIASTLLLFRIFHRMTGEPFKSGFVAALFALHPLNVESVAWIAERKGVLCTFFWMLTLWSYLRYLERFKVGWYCLVVLFFILGGMAKPMIVTLPFALLLLDYWPLGRFKAFRSNAARTEKMGLSRYGPVVEKVPLFVIVVMIAAIGFVAQQRGGALTSIDTLPIGTRVSNAIVSYVIYLWKAVYPNGLTVFYPHRIIPAWQVLTSALFLSLVSLGVVLLRKRRPYLAVGWFWYLGTFVPVIQLVQVGRHFTADRYAYIPLVGIFVMVVWGVSDTLHSLPHRRKVLGFSGMACLFVLGGLTWRQAGYWSDSETLFRHGLQVIPNNYVAHNGLARALEAEGKTDEAIRHFEAALRICPGFTDGRYNFARILAANGKKREAAEQYLSVLKSDPNFVQAHVNLANILADQGELNEAVKHYEKALTLNKDSANAHYNLANAFFRAGRTDDAIAQYRKALDIRPNDPSMHYNLGNAYMRNGNFEQAGYQYSEALRYQPDFVNARVNLGNALARSGDPRKAILQYEKALESQPDHAGAHYNLAGAFSALGKTQKAIAHYKEVLRLQPENASAQFQLGLILSNSGRSSEAEEHFLIALQIKPDFVEARIALADELAVQGKTSEAVDHYNEAMKMNPAVKPMVYYNLACLYALQHKVEKSINCLQKAVENGFRDWNLLKTDKDLQNIRSSEAFKNILSAE
ncbi:MAG: tetratricopeptide repeat protein [Deltaproteobacteria bacterium]|nr:tetratricopeptide repeat protein [Deltaproteobacteria bacterium]